MIIRNHSGRAEIVFNWLNEGVSVSFIPPPTHKNRPIAQRLQTVAIAHLWLNGMTAAIGLNSDLNWICAIMETGVFNLLNALGQTSDETRHIFSEGTRDNPNLTVWRDRVSGVIFIDDHYVGDEEYSSGAYRNSEFYTGKTDFERTADCKRRVDDYRQYYVGKNVCDFGCGAGDFLRSVKDNCKSVVGVELQQDYLTSMDAAGIACTNDLGSIEDGSLDVIFSFHAIEHLSDPVAIIKQLRRKLRPGGVFVLEVPHAGDLLLSDEIGCGAFRNFTLWSQHLILHTRSSLTALLKHCEIDEVRIQGVQRYPVSNHLRWLASGKPGGHRSTLAAMDSDALREAYSDALCKIDATDTITAIARTG